MLILTKRKLRFTLKDDKNVTAATFMSKGGSQMEEAPEWIADTLLFKLAVKDGVLVKAESAPIISAAEPKPEEPKKEAKPAPAPKPAAKKPAPKKTAAKKK